MVRSACASLSAGATSLVFFINPNAALCSSAEEGVSVLGVGGEACPPVTADVALSAVGPGVEYADGAVVAEISSVGNVVRDGRRNRRESIRGESPSRSPLEFQS